MQDILKSWMQRCIKCHDRRKFSSIFDVIRERKRQLSRDDTTNTPIPNDIAETKRQHERHETNNRVTQIWKQFSIIRSKPKEYRDRWQLRYLGIRTMQLLPVTSAEDLCRIVEVLAYVKYRNVVLLQGISETLYWHCRLNKCKLRNLTCFLRACATLKFVPSYRYLDVFLAELDNPHHKSSVGDHLRILQFLVENGLAIGDLFMDMYDRCYKHCLNNMGYMTTQHIASLSQTQLLIDSTDREVFDRICLNFERGIKESEFAHFLMLSNALSRAEIKELSQHYSRLLLHYLQISEKWKPKLINTVLAVLAKYYHRDMVALSRIGHIIVKNIAEFTPEQAHLALNHYSTLSYKHKELVHGVLKSCLMGWSGELAIIYRLQLFAGISNLLAKVEYKHIEAIKCVIENTINTLKVLNGVPMIPSPTTDCNQPMDSLCAHRIPWIVYDKRICHNEHVYKDTASLCPKMVITGNMVLDTIAATQKNMRTTQVGHNKTPKGLRRLIWHTENDQVSAIAAKTELSRLKMVPVSVEVRRRQSLKEWLQEFYNEHFDGIHPASRRLKTRRQMRKQYKRLHLRKGFDRSAVLHAVHLEKMTPYKINRSVLKVKRKMKYAGTRYVQSTQYYINECRVLKRCFLRPYKTVADVQTTESRRSHETVNSNDIPRIYDGYHNNNDDTRKKYLADMWKLFSRDCLYRSSIDNSFTNLDARPRDISVANHGHRNPQISPDTYTDRYPCDYMTDDGTEENLPVKVKLQYLALQQLDTYVDHTSPVYVDNAIILKPVELSSLYSRRLKRKLWALQRAHDTNEMDSMISYMLSNGLWDIYKEAYNTDIPKEQPLYRYVFEIVTAMHKLNFASFELLNQVTLALGRAEPLCVERHADHITDFHRNETLRVIMKTIKRFGYMISAISNILARDASGIIATRLIDTICSSNVLKTLEACVLKNRVNITVPEVTSIIRKFNSLIFFKYGRHQIPSIMEGRSDEHSMIYDDTMVVIRRKTQIIKAYESLNAISKLAIRVCEVEKCTTVEDADKHAVHLMHLLDETVYGTWITSRFTTNTDPSNRRNADSFTTMRQMPAQHNIAEKLLSCIEKGSKQEVALYSICAIQRYIILKNGIEPLDDVCSAKICTQTDEIHGHSRATHGWELTMKNLMERYKIDEDSIQNAICMQYCVKKATDIMMGNETGAFRGGTTVESTTDARTAAAQVLYNYYYNHYNVV